ncbi:MAG: MmgE/PrpD family protein [Granulosicoccus sp.]
MHYNSVPVDIAAEASYSGLMSADNPGPSFTEQLIERCDNTVGMATKQRASLHLLDWLGCILAGQATEAGQSLRHYSQKYLPAGGVAFNATGSSLNAHEAAFINGGLGNILEMDDLHRQSLLHTGDTVLPAALAVAQEVSATMEQLLEAIVKGYEVAIQVGLIASSGGYSAWYNSSTCGVFGAGMAASVLLELSENEMLDALGQCGMTASGLWQCRLEHSMSKQLATAGASRSGVMAAMLASQNFPAPRRILEGELGFFRTLYPSVASASLAPVNIRLWQIDDVSFKPWPACRHTHPVIEAALTLASKIDVNDIASIEIGSYRSGIDFCDNADPTSEHEARFSLQYCVASALLRGSPMVAHFDEAARKDAKVCTLIDVSCVVEDADLQQAFPALLGGRVAVRLGDGQVLNETVTSALGDPENPMSVENICDKFSTLANDAGVHRGTSNTVRSLLTDPNRIHPLSALNKELNTIENQLEEYRHAPRHATAHSS